MLYDEAEATTNWFSLLLHARFVSDGSHSGLCLCLFLVECTRHGTHPYLDEFTEILVYLLSE